VLWRPSRPRPHRGGSPPGQRGRERPGRNSRDARDGRDPGASR